MAEITRQGIIRARTHGDGPGWYGRDAALILSKERKAKQKNPPTEYDGLHNEDVGPKKKVKSVGENTVERMDIDGARLLPDRIDCIPDVGSSPKHEAEKALQCGHWSKAVAKDRSSTESIAKVVGGLVDVVKPYMNWNRLEELLPDEMCIKLKNDVFSSITNFILSVFDMEDFAYHHVSKVREDNFVGLFHKFRSTEKANSFKEQQELRKKYSKTALTSIAKGIDASFKELNDGDMYLLTVYLVEPSIERVIQRLKQSFWPAKLGDPKLALEQMETYIPLKGKYKMQLFLELLREKNYHILDCLIVEACQAFISDELYKALDEKKEEGLGVKVVSRLVADVHTAILKLASIKWSLLSTSKAMATYFLSRGFLGRFAGEVIEVVQIADLERRTLGHPFIGVYHILFGLTFSRVAQHRLVQEGFSKSSAAMPPVAPPYKIYKLAGDHAEICGDDQVELEHLVLAVIAVQDGRSDVPEDRENLDSLRNSDHCIGLSYGSEPIVSFQSLVHACGEDGINIPEILRQR